MTCYCDGTGSYCHMCNKTKVVEDRPTEKSQGGPGVLEANEETT